MLQQEVAFTMTLVQSMRITSILQQEGDLRIMHQFMRIISMLQQEADFENYSDVISNIISISAENFVNVHTGGTEGYISTNTLTISVAGDFDYEDDYLDNGNISDTNALNLNVGGNFSFSESANDFIWRANDTLTVSGSANITAASFNNSGTIDVDNSFNVTAGADFDSATINADTLIAGGLFLATINADNFNVTAGNQFFNRNSSTICCMLSRKQLQQCCKVNCNVYLKHIFCQFSSEGRIIVNALISM